MKVKALIEIPTTVDGERIGPFRRGQEIDLPKPLAEKWIESSMVEKVVEPAIVKKPEQKKPAAKKSADTKAKS